MEETLTSLPDNKQELLTDEIQEIISYRPHWLVRRGNTFFLLITILLLSLTWFISYPDIINASARLATLNPPKLIASKTGGKLMRLFVSNKQSVRKGQHLGYMESTADYNQVIKLNEWINQIVPVTFKDQYDSLAFYPLPSLNDLGELQEQYQQFQNQFEIELQTLQRGYYRKKRTVLQTDLLYLASLKKNATQQAHLQQQDQDIQLNEYKAYESLANDKVIAPLELNQYKSKLIAKEQSLNQLSAQITSSDINSHAKEKEILDLEKQVSDQQQQFRSALLELKSNVEKWIQQFVLIAPEEGTVLFISSLQENEWIENGQALFYVQPEQTSFYVEITAGQKGFGKIKVGQKVMIKVDGYPSNEYGYLTAAINYISDIPSQTDSFLLKADLVNGLKTNYNKPVFFKSGLAAQAEIITDDRRLLTRLSGQLKQIWR